MDGAGDVPDVRSDVADGPNRDTDAILPPDPMDAASEDGSVPPSGDGAVDGDAPVTDDTNVDHADVANDFTTTSDATSDLADDANATDGSNTDAAAVGFPGSALVDTNQGTMINGWAGTPAQLWKLCYTTALHARSGVAFHTNCDFKGPSVSIAKVSYSTETRIIGGYNSGSWTSPAMSTYANNSGSFLFSVTNAFKHGFPGSSSVPYYTLNNQYYGPTFGAGNDWYVHSQLTMGTCRPGYTYECRIGTLDSATCNADFCGTPSGSDYYTLDELEVWVK